MQDAIDLAEASALLSPDDLCRVHATLLSSVYDRRVAELDRWVGHLAVRCRVRPVAHRCVPALLSDLCAFVERGDLPEVAQAAVAHAQSRPFTPSVTATGASAAV